MLGSSTTGRILALGLCCGLVAAQPASAQWLGKKANRKPEVAAPPSNQGFPGYIRRLMSDARAAANRGDLATARTLAERAHKISTTCKAMLASDPDCSPAATEALARQYGATFANPQTSVAQSAPVATPDLTPLLDPQAESAPLTVPPSPAPPVAAPIAPAKPQIAAPAVTAEAVRVARSPAPKASPQVARAPKRKEQPSNSRPTMGFLASQSEWFSQDVDPQELIESPPKPSPRSAASAQPRRAVKPIAPEPGPVEPDEEFFPSETEVEPEVTNAIGHSGEQRWELDVDDAELDSAISAAPQMDPNAARPSLPAETAPAPEDAAPVETRIGVWSPGPPESPVPTRVKSVVTLSDFLDPSTPVASRPAVRLEQGGTPQMIETDFRQPVDPPMMSPARSLSALSPESEPRVLKPTQEPKRLEKSAGASVSVRDTEAVAWTTETAAAEAVPTPTAKSLRLELPLPEWSASQKTMAAGLALVLCGVVLFGLSFRWA